MRRSKRFKERSTTGKIEYVIRGHKVFWVKHRVTCRSRSKNHYEKRMLVGSTYYCVYFEILPSDSLYELKDPKRISCFISDFDMMPFKITYVGPIKYALGKYWGANMALSLGSWDSYDDSENFIREIEEHNK